MIEYKNYKGMSYIEFDELKEFHSLKFLASTRNNLPLAELKSNILEVMGIPGSRLVTVNQVHGNNCVNVDDTFLATYGTPPDADALITSLKNVPLAVYTADCLSVMLYSPEKTVLAIVHSGKAGTQKNAALTTALKMTDLYNLNPASIVAVIGPSIGPCCYEADLWSANESQLKSAGIKRIINHRVCTACSVDRFFSYRKEKGTTGRMISAAAML